MTFSPPTLRGVRPRLTNPGTWFALLIPPVMVVSLANNIPGFVAPPTWEAVLAASGIGLTLASPLAAAGAAWSVSPLERTIRTAPLGSVRSFMARTKANTFALLLGLGAGYVACLLLVIGATHPAWGEARQLVILIPLAAMALTAICIGALIGRAMPSMIAVPLALILQYVVVAVPLVTTDLELARNVLGFGLPLSLQTVHQQFQPAAMVAPTIVFGGVFVAVAFTSRLLNGMSILAGSGAILGGLALAAVTALGSDVPPVQERSSDELACESSKGTEVCLWPEFGADADALREWAIDARSIVSAHGVSVPTRIESSELVPTTTYLAWGVAPGDPVEIQKISFAAGIQALESCPEKPSSMEEFNRELDALAALSIALGADPDIVAQLGMVDDADSGAGVREALGLDSANDGFDLYVAWSAENERICQ